MNAYYTLTAKVITLEASDARTMKNENTHILEGKALTHPQLE